MAENTPNETKNIMLLFMTHLIFGFLQAKRTRCQYKTQNFMHTEDKFYERQDYVSFLYISTFFIYIIIVIIISPPRFYLL